MYSGSCKDTDLPFTFGKVLLDLGADRFVDILVQSRVSTDPAKSARVREQFRNLTEADLPQYLQINRSTYN